MDNKFIANSFQVPNALIDELIRDISPNALKCYLVIIRKTVGWGKEWDKISTTQIMEITGIKKKLTAYKAIKELEEFGLIETKKDKGRLSLFRVVPKKDTSTQKGTGVVPKKDTGGSTQKGYTTKDTLTKDTKQKETKKRIIINSKEKTEEQLPSWLDKKTWEEWELFRREIKKPLVKTTISKQLKLLEKYKDKHIGILETSIQNGWTGLFPPKQQKEEEQEPYYPGVA